jgi:3-phosphoshikimate 1-carboxyvinyltransferase
MRRVSIPLAQMGARFEEEGEQDRLPLRVHGGSLRALSYRSPVASAQIKSALLLAGLTGKVPVEVIEPLRSRDHSERMLRRMGVVVDEGNVADGWSVRLTPPTSELSPLDLLVPGDFSSAAFFIAFGLLGGAGGEIRIANVGLNPTRVGLLDLLREMGGEILVENLREADSPAGEPAGDLVVRPSSLRGGSVGGERIPLMIDEVPILAVLAARVDGVTEIRDAEELRVKESDRIRVLVQNLEGLGAKVDELPDGLRVHGNPSLHLSGGVRAHHDHRIAMAFGVLGALPRGNVEVDDPAVADVSFPGFWDLLASLSSRRAGGPA